MSRGTPILITPTIDECIRAGSAIGLPPLEAMKFFHHHESKGWKIGKERMKSLSSALQTWRLTWLERSGRIDQNGHVLMDGETLPGKKLTGAEIMVRQKELERVLARMKLLENSYDSHAEMNSNDRQEYSKLKARRAELRKQLGVMI